MSLLDYDAVDNYSTNMSEYYNRAYASNAKGNAALTTGIIGTSLSGLLALGAGAFGIGGANRNANCVNPMSAALAELGELKAERYTDSVGIDLYKEIIQQSNRADDKLASNIKEVMQGFIELDKKVAIIEARQPLLFQLAQCGSERYTDWKTKNVVYGEVVLPNTPTVTGFAGVNCCYRPVVADTTPTNPAS